MTQERVERNRLAILAADLIGNSRLMVLIIFLINLRQFYLKKILLNIYFNLSFIPIS